MSDSLYEHGLSRLLDGEMTATEAEDFAAHLRAKPELLRDLRQHLVLWETWSQLQSPERSARAFANSWETRLTAENTADDFCRAVQARVAEPGAEPSAWKRWWSTVRAFRLEDHRSAALASAAAVLTVAAAFFWFGAATTSARPVVTIEGEAVCTRCVLHQTHDCAPAVRVVSGGTTQFYYLDPKESAVANSRLNYCSAHTDHVRATGTASIDHGHLRLDATAVVREP